MFGNGKILVSHTHEDNEACEPLLAALDAWEVNYWFDVEQLSAGLEFFDHIQRALGERDILIRVCTPAAQDSHWMRQELQLARSLRTQKTRDRRLIINLLLKPGYVIPEDETKDVLIDATKLLQAEWVERLRERLGVPARGRGISRRAAIGLGLTTVVTLGAMGLAGNLLLNRPQPIGFVPTGHQPTPTPLPGASRVKWNYRFDDVHADRAVGLALARDMLICTSQYAITP